MTTTKKRNRVAEMRRMVDATGRSPLAFTLPCAVLILAGEFRVRVNGPVALRESRWATSFAELVLPLLAVQLILLGMKWRTERATDKTDGDRFARIVTILTPRGLGFLVLATLVIVCPYGHSDELEAMAIAAVAIVDIFVTLAIAVSLAAQVTRARALAGTVAEGSPANAKLHPSRRLAPTAFLRRNAAVSLGSKVTRELSPAVTDAGDPVEEIFAVGGLSIPFGFRLRVEQELPSRLGGTTRLSLDGPARAKAELQAPLPETRRGLYKLPSPEIAYEDLLGFTRVAVPAGAPTELRVLPRLRRVTLLPQTPPIAGAQIVPLTKTPPTEDLFTVREYRPGDDARRVHWRHSVNLGVLHVRVPETKPASPRRLRLVLDTYLPPKHDEADATLARLLDAMIEGWTSLARTLVRNGDRVTLTAPMRDAATGAIVIRDVEALPGTERQWRALAAEIAWQAETLADDSLAQTSPSSRGRKGTNLVVSAGFYPPSAASLAGGALLLAKLPDAAEDAGDPRTAWQRFLFSTFPVGAEDNKGDLSFGRRVSRSRDDSTATDAYIWARDWSRTNGIPVVSMQQAADAIIFVKEAS